MAGRNGRRRRGKKMAAYPVIPGKRPKKVRSGAHPQRGQLRAGQVNAAFKPAFRVL